MDFICYNNGMDKPKSYLTRLLDGAGDLYYSAGKRVREIAKSKIIHFGKAACEKLGSNVSTKLGDKCRKTGALLIEKGEKSYNQIGNRTGKLLNTTLRPITEKIDSKIPQSSPVLEEIPEKEIPGALANAVRKSLVTLGANPKDVAEDVVVYTDRAVKLKNFQKYSHIFNKKGRFDMMKGEFTAKESAAVGSKGLVLKYYPSRDGQVTIVHSTYTLGHISEVILEIIGWRNMHRKNLDEYRE